MWDMFFFYDLYRITSGKSVTTQDRFQSIHWVGRKQWYGPELE